MPNERHEFSKDVKDRLASRVCLKCSNCRRPTAGPSDDDANRVMVGEAAHICAASRGGPRYDPDQTEAERRSIANGIWLCGICAKSIDDDVQRFTVAEIRRIKKEAERRARHELEFHCETDDRSHWQLHQISKISSYDIPLKLSLLDNGKFDPKRFRTVADVTQRMLVRAFGHTCATTPFDDFGFVLCLKRLDHKIEPGFAPFLLSLHCHISVFVAVFERLARHVFIGEKEPTDLRHIPGEQTVDFRLQLAEFAANRIWRPGAMHVRLETTDSRQISLDGPVSTSTMFRVLALIRNSQVIVWDDVDACPDYEKVLPVFAKITEEGFSWSDFRIEQSDPEKWEFVGPR